MARTLDGVEIHSTQIAQFHVKLFITSDGHSEAFAGLEPQEAHDKGYAWLQALPTLLSEVAAPVAPVLDPVLAAPVTVPVTVDEVVTTP